MQEKTSSQTPLLQTFIPTTTQMTCLSHDNDDCSVYSNAVINRGFRCVLDSSIQPYEGCRSYNVNPTSLLYC